MIYHRLNFYDIRKITHFQNDYLPKHLFLLSSFNYIEIGFTQDECGFWILLNKERKEYLLTLSKRINFSRLYNYNVDDFILNKMHPKYQKQRKLLNKKESLYIRKLTKEDFTDVFLFLQEYHKENKSINSDEYFNNLKYFKLAFEYMYELDLVCNGVYSDHLLGFYLGFFVDNIFYLEKIIVLKDYEAFLLNNLANVISVSKLKLVTFIELNKQIKCLEEKQHAKEKKD